MKLQALEILQLPGVGQLMLHDPTPGVNLVVGPNATGKSSLVRAYRALLEPPQNSDPTAMALRARFHDGVANWEVTRNARSVAWTRDGTPADPPPLPQGGQLNGYTLRIEDLIDPDRGAGEDLAEPVRRALYRNFDLAAARQALAQGSGSRIGGREARALQQAAQARQHIAQTYQALHAEETRLPELERRIEAAGAAFGRAAHAEQALKALSARRRRETIQTVLDDYPAVLERLRGDELERVDQLTARHEQLTTELRDYEHQVREATEQMASSGIDSDSPLDETQLDPIAHALQDAEHARERMQQLEIEQDQARAVAAQAREALRGVAPRHTDKRTITAADLSTAESHAGELHRARRLRDHVQAQLDALDAATSTTPDRPPWLAWLAPSAAGAGVAASATAVLSGAWAAAGFAALGAALAAGAWRLAGQRRNRQERAAERTALQHRLADEQDRVEEAERAYRATAHACGIDPDQVLEPGFPRLVSQLRTLDDAEAAEARAKAEHRRHAEAVTTALAPIYCLLAEHDALPASLPTQPDAHKPLHDLRAALDGLRGRIRQYATARQQRDALKTPMARCRDELERVEVQIAEVYARCGLQEGDRAALERLTANQPAYQEQRQALREAQSVEAYALAELPEGSEWVDAVAQGDEPGLQRRLDGERQAADGLEALQEERAALKERLNQTGRDRKLTAAMAEEDVARERLIEQRERVLDAVAVEFLIDDVDAAFRHEYEPAVLHAARERFARFTHYAWELVFQADGGIRARDTRSGALRELDALSTGTRMQLLLAVRTAWLQRSEQGDQRRLALPLFLDEALTTSDEGRFTEVARTLAQLARDEDRQVFYLTAREQDIALWEQATGAPPTVHRLEVRPETTALPALRLPPRPIVPDPSGRDPAEWAREAGVPAIVPGMDPGAIPAFYLLRDRLDALVRLMQMWEIDTLGPLETLLGNPRSAASFVPDEAERQRWRTRCELARRWHERLQTGRNCPVDRGVLDDARDDQGAIVSDTFMDRVAEKAAELEGDPEALIHALADRAVPRWRQESTDRLAAWLEDHGYIDRRSRLDRAARRRELLARFAGEADESEVAWLIDSLEAGLPEYLHDPALTEEQTTE